MKKTCFLRTSFLTLVLVSSASLVSGQGIPAEQWSAKERQFVEGARALYLQQGIGYTNEQASMAVMQMRQQQAAPAPVRAGVPESEWTPQERTFVEASKRQYAAQGANFSPEQSALAVQSMRDQIARLTGQVGALQMMAGANSLSALAPSRPPMATSQPGGAGAMSEEQLMKSLAAWPAKQGDLDIRGRRDGFDVNGRPVLDAEGKIFSYAYDVTSGEITYAVKTSRGLVIKAVSASAGAQPLVIANGVQGASGWVLQTVTGKELVGETLSILSDGFLVGRSSAAFRYQAGKGVRSIAIPTGYVLTPLQRGNVGATGYVLLEKEQATGGDDPMSKMFSSFKAIGSIIGTNKKDDYALLSLDSGKLYPFNVPADGKNVALLSQCRQRNWLVSECQKAQTFESVYGTDGYKNNSHYYWLMNWVGTPSGPVAFSLENGLADLFITDLTSGKKVLAFQRSFGIADWDVAQHADGKVNIKAKLAFEWKEIADAVSFLQTSP